MRTLYVLFDARCGLCTEASKWLRDQTAYVNLQVLPSDSPEVNNKFPALPHDELAVVSDTGQVWLGNNAFLMTLWALKPYRTWAHRLSSPLLRPLARQAFAELCHNRHAISQFLGLKSEVDLRNHLSSVEVPPCELK